MTFAIISKDTNIVQNIIVLNDVSIINLFYTENEYVIETKNDINSNEVASINDICINNMFYSIPDAIALQLISIEDAISLGFDISITEEIKPTGTIPIVEI